MILTQLTALGHAERLAIFRLLVRRYPDTVSAGEIQTALGVKASTLSTYLAALLRAELVSRTRIGTSLLYAANMENVQQALNYLVFDCCRGRMELCFGDSPAFGTGGQSMTDRKYNVLFICTGNSARSIFAESILRMEAGNRFAVYSAGTKPYSELNPFALDVLKQKGHDISVLRAKNVSELQGDGAPVFDFVFTVCDRAANEECPAWAGQPVSAHWGLPDPVKVEGSDAEKSLAFQQTYGALRNRIVAFAALPIASLDRISLQKAVDDISRLPAGEPA